MPCSLSAQTLAHRNWAGSGMTPDPWWRGAEFYRIDPISFQDANGDGFGDLRGLTDRLDYLQTLGVDALVLAPFPVQPGLTPIEPTYGTEDDLARLTAEATRRRIRLLAELPMSSAHSQADMLATARFLLSHGFAGLFLTSDPGAPLAPGPQADLLRALRQTEANFAGQRILLADHDLNGGAAVPVAYPVYRRADHAGEATHWPLQTPGTELRVAAGLASATELTATAVRTALGSDAAKATVSDTTETLRSASRLGEDKAQLLAALLLTEQGEPMLLFGQELGMAGTGARFSPNPMQWGGQTGFSSGKPWLEPGPNDATANVTVEEANPRSLLNWYRLLGGLRRQYPALRTGTQVIVETGVPGVVAWTRRARTGETTVTVLNVSSRAVAVGLARLGTLRLLAGSPGVLAASGGSLTLPAWCAYVGEVRRAGGLEDLTVPFYVHRRR